MKGRRSLRLCWNLFCLLFFVSYASKAITVQPKLGSTTGSIITDAVPAHDREHNLELSVQNVDTASLIRIRREGNILESSPNISIFSKTILTVRSDGWPNDSTIRWIGNPPDQVSHANVIRLNILCLCIESFVLLHSFLQHLIILLTTTSNNESHVIETSLFRYC